MSNVREANRALFNFLVVHCFIRFNMIWTLTDLVSLILYIIFTELSSTLLICMSYAFHSTEIWQVLRLAFALFNVLNVPLIKNAQLCDYSSIDFRLSAHLMWRLSVTLIDISTFTRQTVLSDIRRHGRWCLIVSEQTYPEILIILLHARLCVRK